MCGYIVGVDFGDVKIGLVISLGGYVFWFLIVSFCVIVIFVVYEVGVGDMWGVLCVCECVFVYFLCW